MLRIKTMFGKNKVLTLPFNGHWITIVTFCGGTSSHDTYDLFDAGQMHLECCQKLRKTIEYVRG